MRRTHAGHPIAAPGASSVVVETSQRYEGASILDMASVSPAPGRASLGRRVVRFVVMNPVTRILVGFIAVGVGVSAAQGLVRPLRFARDQSLTARPLAWHWVGSILVCGAAVAVYAAFVRLYERRWPRELAAGGSGRGCHWDSGSGRR